MAGRYEAIHAKEETGRRMAKMKAAILLIGFGLSVGCKDSSPLVGSGLVTGQHVVVSDFLPGCKSLESFKLYDADLLGKSDIDAYCPVVDGGTRLSVESTVTIFPGTPEEKNVVDTVIESGPRKGQQFWCTVENLESVVQSRQ